MVLGLGCGVQVEWGSTPPAERDLRAIESWIYFVSEQGDGPRAHRVRPDGTGRQAVLGGSADSFPYEASPDGRSVALVRGSAGRHQILVARPDGASARRLAPSRGVNWYPRFSPDGEHVLFESSRASFRDLFRVRVSDGAVTRLTNDREGNFDGAWSPDGSKIAVVSSRHGQLDLFVMDASGGRQVRLTDHAGDVVRPRWLRDGRSIAFLSGRDGPDALFSVRPDGSELSRLTSEAGPVEHFSVRADGGAIAYAFVDTGGRGKIAVLDVVRRRRTVLSGAHHDDAEPAWSPGSGLIAFTSRREGHPDIWLMRADGSARTRLTHDARAAWLPRWLSVTDERSSR